MFVATPNYFHVGGMTEFMHAAETCPDTTEREEQYSSVRRESVGYRRK